MQTTKPQPSPNISSVDPDPMCTCPGCCLVGSGVSWVQSWVGGLSGEHWFSANRVGCFELERLCHAHQVSSGPAHRAAVIPADAHRTHLLGNGAGEQGLTPSDTCFPHLAPNSSILGHQAPPPPQGGGALLLGLGFVNNTFPNGVASFLRTTANGGFSIKCLYVTVGGGHRPPPPPRGGWVGGWVAKPWPMPKLTPPPPRGH